MSFLDRAVTIFLKDLALEVRTRDILVSSVLFSLMMVLIASFAVDPALAVKGGAVGGLLWMTLLFSSALTLGKGMALERENGSLELLLTVPGDRAAIFLGKAAANAVFVMATAAIVIPVFGILFHMDLWALVPPLALVVVLGSMSIAGPGTLVAVIVGQTRARDTLLPLLHFPLEVPALIASVEVTRAIFLGKGLADQMLWINVLAAFDIVFWTVSAALFDKLMEG
ncbi:MAG: heme exporter protein CcmB [Acidobacteriota bacterium]